MDNLINIIPCSCLLISSLPGLQFHERILNHSAEPQDSTSNLKVLPVKLISKDTYSKTCVKWPLKNRQNKDLNDKW